MAEATPAVIVSGPEQVARNLGPRVVTHSGLTRFVIDWISGSDGAVSETIQFPGGIIKRVTIWHDPDDTPTTAYDMTLADEDGIDLLSGRGANIDSSANVSMVPLVDDVDDAFPFAVAPGALTLTIANAGDQKTGRLVIYV